ncbi:MAG TPA: metal-dependent hydrolase [Geodermatophilus sp.]|nr:metal-dependent hydrolase [Geodermatophilus sp.]
MRTVPTGDLVRRLSAVAALGVVLAVDAVLATGQWPVVVVGLLDEPAHLLTAWLVLAALLPDRHGDLLPWALLGAVVIDVDHVPLYLWGVGTATGSGRPITHSLATVVALLALSRVSRGLRMPLCGLAVGLLLHLVRDLATGPGVPLLWPLTGTGVLVPYAGYAALLGLLALAIALRSGDGQRPRSRSRWSRGRWKRRHVHSAQSDPRR